MDTNKISHGEIAASNGDEPTLVVAKNLDNGEKGDQVVDVDHLPDIKGYRAPPLKPYAGMGKEDLLHFSQTPFWYRLRMGALVIFWLGWFGLLAAVVGLTIVAPRCNTKPGQEWFQQSVFYQVYIRSYFDSDGDGVGDIKGLTSKLPYIQSLNTDAVVISSIYASHDAANNPDFGYDVTDHKAINSDYGTMEDFDELIKQAHDRSMKVVLDFIPNHTGDQHPWFVQSQTSSNHTENPYWNYYVWKDCNPNNWVSVYGNSAWSPTTGTGGRSECYFHQFLTSQPDLNLRSGAVRDELESILRFWLDKKVDGFRINSAAYLFENTDLKDNPENGNCAPGTAEYRCFNHTYTFNRPEVREILTTWRNLLNEYSQGGQYRVMITDADLPAEDALPYFGEYGRKGSNIAQNFDLSRVSPSCSGRCVQELIDNWVAQLKQVPENGTVGWTTSSQDGPRLSSVVGEKYAMAATLVMLTLPGTALTYYGEELAMGRGNSTDAAPIDPAGKINDTWSRDPFRTPMQWDDTLHAGFTNGSTTTPWLAVNLDFNNRNVKDQEAAGSSPLKTFRQLVALHKENAAFHYGNFMFSVINDNIVSYKREYDGVDRFLVVANFGQSEVTTDFSAGDYQVPGWLEVAVTTGGGDYKVGTSYSTSSVKLLPGHGLIFKWAFSR